MVLTNVGRGLVRDASKALFINGGVGLSVTNATVTDTGLFGGGTIVDACDAVTGWVNSGDAGTELLNNVAGEFKEGTGCLNLPLTYSTGVSTWSKTISSTDLSNKKLLLWFYISSVEELDDSTDTISITLGTGGYTNSNSYYTSRDEMSNGYNSILVDVANEDLSNGTGLVSSTCDRIRISVRANTTQATNSMRMDYWRSYEAGTLGVTDSIKVLTQESGDYYFKTIHNLNTTESNGLSLVEAGDSTATALLSRFTFTTVEKGENTELQVDKYYYIEGN